MLIIILLILAQKHCLKNYHFSVFSMLYQINFPTIFIIKPSKILIYLVDSHSDYLLLLL